MKIGFLYNHDALHQVSHTAPVIAALADDPRAEVTVLTSSDAQAQRVRALIGDAAANVRFVALGIGPLARALDAGLRWIAPFRRIAVLRENLAEFATLDALVVPETTSLMLRDRFALTDLKYVWIPHGAGDRSVGFRNVMKGFDLVLLSGSKVRDRMLALGLVTPDNHAIVGYPKFETVDLSRRPRLFDDGQRPAILYNPHFDPLLSSWYSWGEVVVDTIIARGDVDLAVAPHVMLFQRRIHASVEHRRLHWRRDLPARWRSRAGLIVDPGSTRSIDMSYTLGADIYIGDTSSQIYEWIARPRPAIFLNPGRIDWADDPSFAHWQLGEVVDDLAQLDPAIDRALAEPHRFDAAQRDAFARTFDRGDRPAARRAADAILKMT